MPRDKSVQPEKRGQNVVIYTSSENQFDALGLVSHVSKLGRKRNYVNTGTGQIDNPPGFDDEPDQEENEDDDDEVLHDQQTEEDLQDESGELNLAKIMKIRNEQASFVFNHKKQRRSQVRQTQAMPL